MTYVGSRCANPKSSHSRLPSQEEGLFRGITRAFRSARSGKVRLGLGVLVIFAPIGFVLCGTASAASIQADYELAQRYWGTTPSGCSSIEVGVLEPTEGNEETIGEATVPDEPGPCTFKLATATFSYERCVLAIHEFGHLLGLEHSPDRTSVMYPMVGSQRVGVCIHQSRTQKRAYCRGRPMARRALHACLLDAKYAKPWVY